MIQTHKPQDDDEMSSEINFGKGTRGKFYKPDLKLNLPVYLDEEVQQFLADIASRKGLAISDVANDLLKKDIALIETAR